MYNYLIGLQFILVMVLIKEEIGISTLSKSHGKSLLLKTYIHLNSFQIISIKRFVIIPSTLYHFYCQNCYHVGHISFAAYHFNCSRHWLICWLARLNNRHTAAVKTMPPGENKIPGCTAAIYAATIAIAAATWKLSRHRQQTTFIMLTFGVHLSRRLQRGLMWMLMLMLFFLLLPLLLWWQNAEEKSSGLGTAGAKRNHNNL